MTFARGLLGPAAGAVLLAASVAGAQTSNDPFSAPIAATEGVITVGAVEFAVLPDFRGETARMMRIVDEPVTGRLFVSDMWGLVYTVSYDGETVTQYLDLTAPRWAVDVHARGRERGFQSFALHPQFGEVGASGYGKLYAWTDSSNTAPPAENHVAAGHQVAQQAQRHDPGSGHPRTGLTVPYPRREQREARVDVDHRDPPPGQREQEPAVRNEVPGRHAVHQGRGHQQRDPPARAR